MGLAERKKSMPKGIREKISLERKNQEKNKKNKLLTTFIILKCSSLPFY